jgi:hypothetical protein
MWSFSMSKKIKTQPDDKEQAAAFRKAARELGADAGDDRFKDVLRTLAKAKPQPQPPKKAKGA